MKEHGLYIIKKDFLELIHNIIGGDCDYSNGDKRPIYCCIKDNKIDSIDCDYDNDLYERLIKGLESEPERGSRCSICYQIRMEKTAMVGKDNNYDFFCTTLSVSPYKNSDLINKIGKQLEEKYLKS